jgi:DNA-binding MarR family transcriptional regulator
MHRLLFSPLSHQRMHAVCTALGINPGLMRALFQLGEGQAKSMRTLAEDWDCDASYVTALVDGLEERGFAERHTSPTDRRVKLVALTPAGLAARAKLFELMHEPPPFFESLSATDRRTLRDLMRKLVTAAELEG